MIPQEHSLRQLFHEVVTQCYDVRLGMNDPEISSYVGDLLTDFCQAENVYRIRDAAGHPVREIAEMLLASDPVNGTAASFDQERLLRKHIGDYSLFFAGMYPDSRHGSSYLEIVQAGKESYFVVSQFDLFEYASEAPFFSRLSTSFESCIYGLNLVRGELDKLKAFPTPRPQKHLM